MIRTIKIALLMGLVGMMTFTSAMAADPKPKIMLAGDSTVTESAGWGAGFAKVLNDNVDFVNTAKGGRSSKSFRDEGHWQKALDEKPTVLLIQFGHNDQPGKGPERETDPNTTFRENLGRYVDEARAIGAKPVIVTSLARRRWADDGIHVKSDLTAYADAAKAVAAEKGVPVIDLHTRSIEVYESLGQKGVELISPPGKEGGLDGTHLNIVGSELFGPLVADELKRMVPEISRNIGWLRPEKRASTTQPTTVPTKPERVEQFKAKAGTPTPQGVRTVVVAADGTGEFTTIQAAIETIPDNNADRTTLRIKPGVYTGPIVLTRSKQNVTFEGESADNTIITYALNVGDPIPENVPEKMAGNGVIVLGEGFEARNLTFRNTAGDRGQAMALRLQADRASIKDCKLLGWQDTLLVHSGRHYFKNTYIEGRVDFIYGGATSVFDNCHIHTKEGGYITAASTPEEQPFGYLFYQCQITGHGAKAYLGRPWRPFGAVAFVKCEIGDNIRPEGWHNWGKESNETTARYVEYKNTGPGADRSARVKWARELSDEEAAHYTPQNFLKGTDGWNPTE